VAGHKNMWYNACHICRVHTVLKFAQQFSRPGRSLENGVEAWKNGKKFEYFFLEATTSAF